MIQKHVEIQKCLKKSNITKLDLRSSFRILVNQENPQLNHELIIHYQGGKCSLIPLFQYLLAKKTYFYCFQVR